MTNSDNLLEEIIKCVESDTELFDITLTVGGTIITGQITPHRVWLESNIAVLSEVGSKFANTFALAGATVDDGKHLHLTQAKAVLGMEVPVSVGAGYLRISTEKVDSWSIGRISIGRAQ